MLFQPTPPHRGRRSHYSRSTTPRRDFNPRPHTGGDPKGSRLYPGQYHFNPRPHTGGDCKGKFIVPICRISTHAPTQGATVIWIKPLKITKFQPTPPHRGRLYHGDHRGNASVDFNPRPHTGGDVKDIQTIAMDLDFNPRPHTGGDEKPCCKTPCKAISTHAPTQGATATIMS